MLSFFRKIKDSLGIKKSKSPQKWNSLKLDPLESRVNPSQVVDVTFVNGALTFTSNTFALETNSFNITQLNPGSNILQLQGSGGTTFKGSVNLFSSGYGSPNAEINTLSLSGFNKIQILGGDGNDQIVFGNLDGNVIGDVSQADFSFNIDTFSSNAGSSQGADTLLINGEIGIKGDGYFATDITASGAIFSGSNLNLDSISLAGDAYIHSIGSGAVRLVADGLSTSNISFQQSADISIGSGDVFLQAGSVGSIQFNSNAINTSGGDINFKSFLVLNSSSSVVSTTPTGLDSAKITFYKDIYGVSPSGQDLSVQSRGIVEFKGSIGTATIPLGAVDVGFNNFTYNPSQVKMGDIFAKSLESYSKDLFSSSGTISTNYIDGVILQTSASGSLITIGKQNSLAPAINTTNLGTVSINNSGALQINGDIISKGSISQSGSGTVYMGNSGVSLDLNITTESKSISFKSANSFAPSSSSIVLNQNVNINSNSSGLSYEGGSINFGSPIDGNYQAQLNAGVGGITFSGAIGSNISLAAISVVKAGSFLADSNINANSLALNEINGVTVFNGIQNYSKAAGLAINSYTSGGTIYINNAINLSNDAQLAINNTGILSINSLGVITSVAGPITLGGSGGGKLLLNANFNSTSGNMNFLNLVDFYSDIVISNNSGTVTFTRAIESMKSTGAAGLNLQSSINDANFVFQSTVGNTNALGNITVSSAKNVTWISDVKAGSFTVNDMTGLIAFNGNLSISGNITTNTTSNVYNLAITGNNNQIQGVTTLNHLGTTTLGNSNTDSFLFSGGLEETGNGGVYAMGSFVSGSSMNFQSEFYVSGNNVGQVTFAPAQDSIFYARLNVQPNERFVKNGSGGIRLISNSGGTFQGTLTANAGIVTVLDDFSSMIGASVSGGTLSGTGSYGNISALSGSIAPGDIVGPLNAGSVTANNLSSMAFDLGTISTANDSLAVNGVLTLSQPSLSITPGQFLVAGQTYVIIQNDSSDAVIGNFASLPEGATFNVGNYSFQITYKGGNGNDVALTLRSNSNPVPPSPNSDNPIVMATAADAGGGPMVTVRYADGHEYSFFAYNPSFTGGVRVSMGDVNGDGYTDLVTGVGVGGGPHIKVWNLTSGIAQPVASFFAFESAFTGGLYLGVGNLNGDAYADIIVGAGPGGGPRVTAFAGAQAFAINQNQVLTNFFAYSDTFRGGVTVAAADRTGDGVDEIVTGAGYGGGPNVSVFQLIQTTPNQFNPQLIQNFFVFDTTFTGGIFVAGGRFSNGTNSSGQPLDDIFVGTGPGTKASVAVAFGTGGFYYLAPFGNFQGGARVGIASTSPTAGGTNYLVAAAGPGGGPQVNVYNNSFGVVDSFFAINPAMTLGVFANTNIL